MNQTSLRMCFEDTRLMEVTHCDLETKSILKPAKVRAPLQEVDLGLDNHIDPDVIRKRRVSFAGVNKIKEFNSKAESVIICSTPAYEEAFSTSSDSSALTASVIINGSTILQGDCTFLNDTMDLTDIITDADSSNVMDITYVTKPQPQLFTQGVSKQERLECFENIDPNQRNEKVPPKGIYDVFGGSTLPKPTHEMAASCAKQIQFTDPTKVLLNELLEDSKTDIVEDMSLVGNDSFIPGSCPQPAQTKVSISKGNPGAELLGLDKHPPLHHDSNKHVTPFDSGVDSANSEIRKNINDNVETVRPCNIVTDNHMRKELVLTDDSVMEFTELLPQNIKPTQYPAFHKEFSNMELTEAVNYKECLTNSCFSQENNGVNLGATGCRTVPEHKLNVPQDMQSQMEFTQVLQQNQHMPIVHQSNEAPVTQKEQITNKINSQNIIIQQQNFNLLDVSLTMDFTEVLKPSVFPSDKHAAFLSHPDSNSIDPVLNNQNKEQLNKFPFVNMSNRVTLPQAQPFDRHGGFPDFTSTHVEVNSSKMELTEALPHFLKNKITNICENSVGGGFKIDHEIIKTNETATKTLTEDASFCMEFTEAIPSNKPEFKVLTQDKDGPLDKNAITVVSSNQIKGSGLLGPPETDGRGCDDSQVEMMDFTEALPSKEHPFKFLSKDIKGDTTEMEITEVLPATNFAVTKHIPLPKVDENPQNGRESECNRIPLFNICDNTPLNSTTVNSSNKTSKAANMEFTEVLHCREFEIGKSMPQSTGLTVQTNEVNVQPNIKEGLYRNAAAPLNMTDDKLCSIQPKKIPMQPLICQENNDKLNLRQDRQSFNIDQDENMDTQMEITEVLPCRNLENLKDTSSDSEDILKITHQQQLLNNPDLKLNSKPTCEEIESFSHQQQNLYFRGEKENGNNIYQQTCSDKTEMEMTEAVCAKNVIPYTPFVSENKIDSSTEKNHSDKATNMAAIVQSHELMSHTPLIKTNENVNQPFISEEKMVQQYGVQQSILSKENHQSSLNDQSRKFLQNNVAPRSKNDMFEQKINECNGDKKMNLPSEEENEINLFSIDENNKIILPVQNCQTNDYSHKQSEHITCKDKQSEIATSFGSQADSGNHSQNESAMSLDESLSELSESNKPSEMVKPLELSKKEEENCNVQRENLRVQPQLKGNSSAFPQKTNHSEYPSEKPTEGTVHLPAKVVSNSYGDKIEPIDREAQGGEIKLIADKHKKEISYRSFLNNSETNRTLQPQELSYVNQDCPKAKEPSFDKNKGLQVWNQIKRNVSFMATMRFTFISPTLWRYSFPWPLDIRLQLPECDFNGDTKIINIKLLTQLNMKDPVSRFADSCMQKNMSLLLSEDWLNSQCKTIKDFLIVIDLVEQEYKSLEPIIKCLKRFYHQFPFSIKDFRLQFKIVNMSRHYVTEIKINLLDYKKLSGKDVEVTNHLGEIRQKEVQKLFDDLVPNDDRFMNLVTAVNHLMNS